MRLLRTVSLSIVLCPIALAAQNGGVSFGVAGTTPGVQGGGASGSPALAAQPPAGLCPVSLRAQHKADGGMEQVDSARVLGVGQWLHLVLADRNTSVPSSARVTVHGYSNKARVTQAGSGSRTDAAKTITVKLAAQPDRSAAGDLWAPGMTAVTRIDLNSLSYADGTAQAFTAQQACHVAPDPFMLVAGR